VVAASRPETTRRSAIGRVLRTIFWALVVAFAVGFLVGTLLRRELEKPVRYIGEREVRNSVAATRPRDVGDAQSCILVPRDHEEQIG
jgi:hypothetical protein